MRFHLPVLAVLALALGCAPGTPHDVPSGPPQRVILFGPNLTQTAVRLGHAERLVGITDYCPWPARLEEPPRVGGAIDPDLEAIARLQPDLLVVQGESSILRSFADSQGLRLASVKMDDDVASILRGIVAVDSLLSGGDAAGGRALADTLRGALDALAVERTDRPSVLLVVSRDPDAVRNVLTAGEGTFLDDLVNRIGARGWAASRGRGYFDVSLEALVASPPDVVLEIASAGSSDDPARWRQPWIDRLGEGVRVARLVDDHALVPGPGIVRTARAMATVLRDRAPDGDPR